MENAYICIDLKSFYASVECVERGLDPLKTNLVVADESRTEKTICLAVTPPLKALGIPGRPRLFEVVQGAERINAARRRRAGRTLRGSSFDADELERDPYLALDYIVAAPRMAHYMEYSARIYRIYLEHIAPEDIHAYSIDEVFIEASHYLTAYKLTAWELAVRLLGEIYDKTRITATAGIGTNMYLAKVAMDIVAKHADADENGARIAELDEMSYRRCLWAHRPITDFWRVGKGYAKRLERHGICTMGDVARCSIENEDLLYDLFGVNAELLIDHAWGRESCEMKHIKAYKPASRSLGSGQVLKEPYSFDKARIVVREMTDALALSLVDKGLVADQIVMTVGYDAENLKDPTGGYSGEVKLDRYGRRIPKNAHGTANLGRQTSSSRLMVGAAAELFDRIADKSLSIRRLNVTFTHIAEESKTTEKPRFEQLDLFTDYEKEDREREREKEKLKKEQSLQRALLDIKKHYGKNAVVKGISLTEGATAMERNNQIGGHRA